MTISKDLFLAILAMDSYNRGYEVGVVVAGTQIGTATIGTTIGDSHHFLQRHSDRVRSDIALLQ